MTENKTIATCAKCGEKKELCNSARLDGVMQPRFCRECVIQMLKGDEETEPNYLFWMIQLIELDDHESIEVLKKQLEEEQKV